MTTSLPSDMPSEDAMSAPPGNVPGVKPPEGDVLPP